MVCRKENGDNEQQIRKNHYICRETDFQESGQLSFCMLSSKNFIHL